MDFGKFYRQIRSDDIEKDFKESKPYIEKDNFYVKICKKLYKQFSNLGSNTIDDNYKKAIEFLSWRINAKQLSAAIKAFTILVIFSSIVLFGITYFLAVRFLPIKISAFTLLLSIFLFYASIASILLYLFMYFPMLYAKYEARKALSYVPEIISYLSMSMKLSSNLERAVDFAASRGRGKLADDFRKIIWDTKIGVYNTVSEALEKLAYRWEPYSSELKEAIMLIKSSMLEDNEEKRSQILDEAVESALQSIKLKMEAYARSLSQPSLILFYVGVLLPLLLIVILPIGSVFANLPFAKTWVLALLYDIIIPAVCLGLAIFIINKVPRIYKPPKIPDNYPGLPKKNHLRIKNIEIDLRIIIVVFLVFSIALSYYLHLQYDNTLEKIMKQELMPEEFVKDPDLFFEQQAKDALYARLGKYNFTEEELKKEIKLQKMLFIMRPGHDITPYFFIYGILLSLVLALSFYLYFSSKYKKDVQDYYMKMEDDFREVLYILASRLGEGKPIEEALQKTKDFFPQLIISQDLFAKTLDNINLLGLPLDQALFDPTFGSMKRNPSDLLRNSMKIIADAIALGPKTASKTIMSLSLQMKNLKEIKDLVKKLIADISEMLATMATFIAPAVLGITVSLQKIIVLTLYSLSSSGLGESLGNISKNNISGLSNLDFTKLAKAFNVQAISNIASPTAFLIVLTINVLLIVIILSFFVSMINEDNELYTKILIAKTLPIAITVFIIASIVAGTMVKGFA